MSRPQLDLNVDPTLVCIAALSLLAPAAAGDAGRNPDASAVHFSIAALEAPGQTRQLPYHLADSYDEFVIRAQSSGSPFYDYDQPSAPAGGYAPPQYPVAPSAPTYAPPSSVPPTLPSPFVNPGAPYNPVTPTNPFLATPPALSPARPFQRYGVNGAQPYDFGASVRLDTGYIAPSSTGNGYGELDVFELDLALPYVFPSGDGNVVTFTPQYNSRLFNGPSSPPGAPGFPNDLYRFGWDFQYDFITSRSNWSGELGFTPSINTDFEKSLNIDAINWDGRAIAYLQATRKLTLALGVLYWDRVDDVILPYAGVIWLPNDRWELRLVFPEPRVSYFAGHVWGDPTWIYARAKYDIGAWQVEVPTGTRNRLQMESWRIMFGARKDQGWGSTYLEAGWVLGRKVRYAQNAPGFDINDAFMFRGGLRF